MTSDLYLSERRLKSTARLMHQSAWLLFLIAASLRFGLRRSRPLGSLSANAYSLYLVHYVFVVWMQYALLALSVSAVLKAPMVFSVTLIVSWIIILAVQRIPLGARLIGLRPTPVAA